MRSSMSSGAAILLLRSIGDNRDYSPMLLGVGLNRWNRSRATWTLLRLGIIE
jgi:hypothetical protein